MKSEWKDIKGYEGIYKVNELGDVMSVPRVDGSNHLVGEKLLKKIERGGRTFYGLSKNGRVKTHYLHILVADAFDRKNEFKNLDGEVWKSIDSDNGLEVSNKGRVRTNLKRYSVERMTYSNCSELLPNNNGNGYLQITYKLNGNKKVRYIHRLVAEKFIKNPKNLPQVNHIDGNKSNNSVENLEWVTALQNIHHAVDNNLTPSGLRSGNANLTANEIGLFQEMIDSGKYSSTDYMKRFGLSRHSVLDILNGKSYKNEFNISDL